MVAFSVADEEKRKVYEPSSARVAVVRSVP
jgi:hypothetical protein